jgi:ribosomal protein S18 acetylase RimI-like enzyme
MSVCALFNGEIVGVMLFSSPSEEAVTTFGIIRLVCSRLLYTPPTVIWRGMKSALDDERHRPKEPHYYLETLGVAPKHQSQGIGGAMVSYLVERAEREKVLIYLSTTNPKTIPLYERLGFRTVTTTAPNGVPNVHMARAPNQG